MATAVQHRPSASRRSSNAGPSSERPRSNRLSTTSGSSGTRDPDAKTIGQWRIGRTIGKGSSGRVKIAKHALTGQYAAVKIVPKGLILSSRLSMSEAGTKAEKLLLGIEREIVIMKLIDHPNVLSLFDVWETNTDLYLIMEYVPGGELFDYLVRRGRLPPHEALHYFQQIIYAVDYCHRFNICHRDLKPENLLLDKDKNIKVADFGMAAWQADENLLETSCGSPHYASPEIVAGKSYNGAASDIWSCGIILFALLTGRLPFDDDNIRTLLQKVKIGLFDMPTDIDEPARDLLRRMLEKEPELRITMPEIMQHRFFRSRAPRLTGGREMPAPPSLDVLARPVRAEDIDVDIMGNLKTLWQGATEDAIYASLMGPEKTWEKAIYHLLVKYRSRHLENYNMDADSDEEDSDSPRPHGNRAAPPPPVQLPPPSKQRRVGPAQSQTRRKPVPLAENEAAQNSATPPPRPQAPTPKKAGAAVVTADSPAPSRTPSKLNPRNAGPAGPRSHRGATSPLSPHAPHIMLQEATPIKDHSAGPVGMDRSSAGATSPIPSPTASHGSRPLSHDSNNNRPVSHGSSNRPVSNGSNNRPLSHDSNNRPLSPPRVDNAQLQNFLEQIANQLNTINIRSSTASSSSNHSALQSPEFQAYMAYMSQQSPTPESTPLMEGKGEEPVLAQPQPQPQQANANDQFADADDDTTDADAMSVYSASGATSVHRYAPSPVPSVRSPINPVVGLGLGGAPRTHQNRSGPPPVSGRWSQTSGSYRTRSMSSRPESPALMSPTIYSPLENHQPLPHHALPAVPASALKAERAAPAPPSGARTASRKAPPVPRPMEVAKRAEFEPRAISHLGREDSYMFVEFPDEMEHTESTWGSSRGSAFSGHRATDGFGMLKKRKKMSTEPTATASPSSQDTHKRSWFNNLFSFKPASCEVLIRSADIKDGIKRSKRMLESYGVRVVDAQYQGIAGLRCKVADTSESRQGGSKAVRFRVEFERVCVNGAYFRTRATLTLEKGAHSTFREIYDKLKTALEVESPQTSTPSFGATNFAFTMPNPAAKNRPSLKEANMGPTSVPQRPAPTPRQHRSAPNTPQLASFAPEIQQHRAQPQTIRF